LEEAMTVYFIELKNFTEQDGASVRHQMAFLSNLNARLIEWTPALRDVCSPPDLTLIAAQGLNWSELAVETKSSSGRYIALHGNVKPTLGLAVLPLHFSFDDLFAHMSERKAIVTSQSARGQTLVKFEHEFKTTMPMEHLNMSTNQRPDTLR
jgi:hypothetical protein